MVCTQCPRGCAVNRLEKKGVCGMPETFKVARAAPHFWEEPCISGTKGSGTVFFTGCSLGCVFCQNGEISRRGIGIEITAKRLTEIFDELVSLGVHNINLVNPTHYALQIADVLESYHCPVPVVYNSGGYETVETLKKLEGLIDIYLPDMKYVSPEISLKYSGAADYFEYASQALIEMRRQVNDEFDSDGMMSRGMIVRHLILPKNTRNSLQVLSFLASELPGTIVSLMAQYTPCGDLSKHPELTRKITRREYEKVVDAMLEAGFSNGFVQELDAAGENFIPDFDLSGV